MSAADLEVKVTGDAAGGVDALKKVQVELGRTAIAAAKTDSSLGKLKTGSNQATTALTNLGRVVQDAPFGFIGIANNINPLLESFQRLKAETGSTKTALQSLASGLVGAGGLGIAVSALSSVLSVLALNGFFKSGQAAEEAGKKVKTYTDYLRDASGEAAKEQTEVLGLVSVLKSETETRQRKLSAIKELQDIQPEIFKNLKLEHGAVVGLDTAYKAYVANLQNVIQAEILRSQIEDKITRQLELQKLITSVSGPGFIKPTKDLSAASLELAKSQREVNEQIFRTRKILGAGITGAQASAELDVLNKQIESLTEQLFKLSKTVKVPEQRIKDVRTISDVLADMNDELRKLSAREILLNTNEAINKIKAMEDAFNELVEKFKLGTTSPIIVDLAFRINEAKARLAFSELLARTKLFGVAEREGEKNKLKIVVNVQPIFKTDPAGINKEAFKLGQEINEIVKNTFVDAFSGLGEAIGDALSGVSIGNAFDGIVKSLAGGLKAIGRKIIETNVQLAILKKIGFSNPAVGIAVGVAITALGAALQNAVSKQKAFATGVRNFEGGFAMVGERGPERVFLPKGSSVQPNNELSAFSGGGITLMPSIQYSGDGFRIMLDKVDKRWGRNN